MTLPDLPTWATLQPSLRALIIAVAGLLAAPVISFLFRRVVFRFTAKTKTDLDDLIAKHLQWPVSLSFTLAALGWALQLVELPKPWPYVARGVLLSLVIAIWTLGAIRLFAALLVSLGRHTHGRSVVNERTQPLLDMTAKGLLYAAALYFLFLAWDIDLTAWLASAGVFGVAMGFAAQETLSNLFAGIFIIADSPYKVGDFLSLESGQRGRVTEIGLRTTRMITRDDIEVIVPNSQMANATIVNESGGPSVKRRVGVQTSVAYGSDVDRVRAVMLQAVEGVPNVASDPVPFVSFESFGDSGLNFTLYVWLDHPVTMLTVVDRLNTAIYKKFTAEGIEIPYPKRDVYLHRVEGA